MVMMANIWWMWDIFSVEVAWQHVDLVRLDSTGAMEEDKILWT
jgi:hypothetical protein